MIRELQESAYNSLLREGKIGTAADQVAAGDHAHTSLEIKTADETVNNSSSLQDDDELQGISLLPGIYHCLLVLRSSFKTASDFKWALSFSGTATSEVCHWSYAAPFVQIAGGWHAALINSFDSPLIPTAHTAGIFKVEGTLVVTAAGSLKLQWAQRAAVVEDTIVRSGSFLKITKV